MPAIFNTLDELSSEIQEMGALSAEYWDKQVHSVPKSQTVDRINYLVKHSKDKVILHIGCTGQLDKELCRAAKKCYGIDKNDQTRPDFYKCNLDTLTELPAIEGVELIICGEVIEHLSNPGYFLGALRKTYNCPVIITVPNAMCAGGMEWLVKRGRENVHRDHVAYYSYTTLKTLLSRHGYTIARNFWYGGKPYVSEGLIVVALPQKE